MMAGVLSGCATTSSRSGGGLEIKVAQLERRLSDSDTEIQELKYEVSRLTNQIDSMGSRGDVSSGSKNDRQGSDDKTIEEGSIRVSASAEDVQKALQKAGYYDGAVDGKIGRKTIDAIKNFQKEHDLKVDGVIGVKTWQAMKSYLE
jgi:peptidoglycan hydrolase-like protein with peptidoglycan-binding domain